MPCASSTTSGSSMASKLAPMPAPLLASSSPPATSTRVRARRQKASVSSSCSPAGVARIQSTRRSSAVSVWSRSVTRTLRRLSAALDLALERRQLVLDGAVRGALLELAEARLELGLLVIAERVRDLDLRFERVDALAEALQIGKRCAAGRGS